MEINVNAISNKKYILATKARRKMQINTRKEHHIGMPDKDFLTLSALCAFVARVF
jgi:hypothetical protein